LDLHVHRPIVALKKDDSLLLLFEKLLQRSFEPYKITLKSNLRGRTKTYFLTSSNTSGGNCEAAWW
jgi:hypothetical protein